MLIIVGARYVRWRDEISIRQAFKEIPADSHEWESFVVDVAEHLPSATGAVRTLLLEILGSQLGSKQVIVTKIARDALEADGTLPLLDGSLI